MPRSSRGDDAPPRTSRRGGDSDGRRNSRNSSSASTSSESSAPIDPSKPAWWNEQKKEERRKADSARRESLRAENERKKTAAGNVMSYGRSSRGGMSELQDNRVGVRESTGGNRGGGKKGYDRGGAGAHQYSDEKDDPKKADKLKQRNMDAMDMMQDDRIKKSSADDELQGRSLWDLVDRGTLMVGCCLILVVIVAVTIPVTLISNDEPYIEPPPDPSPTQTPTRARSMEFDDIRGEVGKITPGGVETLDDPSTAHHRALQWLVYEDGMELGASKDHLHQRLRLFGIHPSTHPPRTTENGNRGGRSHRERGGARVRRGS